VRPSASLVLLLLVFGTGCETHESPLEPSDLASPALAFTQAPGSLLGTTNAGELVKIDTNTWSVVTIGDAGIFNGKEIGWTGLSFSLGGTLFASSRNAVEPANGGCPGFFGNGSCSHLYELDPASGAVVREVGPSGARFVSDIDWGAGVLYASAHTNETATCCGILVSIDTIAAQTTWHNLPTGYGSNPSTQLSLQNGAFAVHPVTGELWGIENNFSNATMVFRIDPVAGVAIDPVRLGSGGTPVTAGFDALEILPDGRFLALRGGPGVPATERLYEVNPVPDPTTNLAEVTPLPLTYASPLIGHLNALEVTPTTVVVPLTLQLVCPQTVERAQSATCDASDPNGPVTGVDFNWSFQPDLVPFTPNSSETFAPRPVTEGPPTSTSAWVGQLVHPGTVTVVGVRGTESATASASISVTDRAIVPFQIILDLSAMNTAQLPVPQRPSPALNTGRNHRAPYLGRPDNAADFFEGSAQIDTVQAGPNKGYLYVASSDFRARRTYSLNPWIEQTPGYPYPAGGVGATTWSFVSSQPGANPALVRDATIAHEVGLGGPNPSHQQRLLDAAGNFESCGNIQATFERLTASSLFDLSRMMTSMQVNSFSALFWAADHSFVNGHQPANSVVADWINQPGLRTVMNPPVVATNRPPPPLRCDVSNL
jgi:hypothetical protein